MSFYSPARLDSPARLVFYNQDVRLMGDCGVRNAELRSLTMRVIRRPRANSAHHQLFVRGKGDVEREIPIPAATQAALEAWLRVHPSARAQVCVTTTRAVRPPHTRARNNPRLVKQSRRPIRTAQDFKHAQSLCNRVCRFAVTELNADISLTVTDCGDAPPTTTTTTTPSPPATTSRAAWARGRRPSGSGRARWHV